MRNIPNIIVSAPMNEVELRNLMFTAQLEKNKMPFSIRYPRGHGVLMEWEKPFEEIEIGKARLLSKGKDIAILSIGYPGNDVVSVVKKLEKESIGITHWDMRFASPADKETLHSVFKEFKKIITVEDGVLKGGFGSSVIEFMCDNGYSSEVKRLGIHDYFVEQGSPEELYAECGFGVAGIEGAIREMLSAPPLKGVGGM
jgi:1-deoxy-D-xylulose-5-phosphate synthase